MNQLSEPKLKAADFARRYMDELCLLLVNADFDVIAKIA